MTAENRVILEQTNDLEQEKTQVGHFGNEMPQKTEDRYYEQNVSITDHKKQGKFFYYDTPLPEETGIWILVSIPPVSEIEHEEWTRGSCMNGGYILNEDMGWNQFGVAEAELTMWDAAQGKVPAIAQLPTHDLTDLSTLRSWLNFPWGQSMEYEIYKTTNTILVITSIAQVGTLKPEKSISDAILKHARGLAILTVAKVGVIVSYNIGTGVVVARREDGSWSPPSAISSFGVGWGVQAGGELADLIIVLKTKSAVQTFSGNVHLSVGAGLSAAAGIIGRAAEADFHAGDGGYAAYYTYSCSKGAFIGCSLKGSVVTTRYQEKL